jgi:trimeric autotransporter adhesin
LLVGGAFSSVGTAPGVEAHGIAKWDGVEWGAVGEGASLGGFDPGVNAILVDDVENLDGSTAQVAFVCGQFSTVNGQQSENVAMWDGTSWSGIGGGVKSKCGLSSLARSGGVIYVGLSCDEPSVPFVHKWDGTAWTPIAGLTHDDRDSVQGVSALAWFNGVLVAGGEQLTVNGSTRANIAQWDGEEWSVLGGDVTDGADSPVWYLGVNDSLLFVTGSFQQCGNETGFQSLATWDGETWRRIGQKLDDDVPAISDLVFVAGDLYACGRWLTMGNVTSHGVAVWNGTAWSAFDKRGFGFQTAMSIAVNGSDVIVGGWMTKQAGEPVHHLALWNGTAWAALGGGVRSA